MSLLVQKYGGSSLASSQCVRDVAVHIADTITEGHTVLVVVSAMAGETERFLSMARQFSDDPDPRELSALLSCGEIISAALLASALRSLGINAHSYSAAQLDVKGQGHYLNAQIKSINTKLIRQKILSGEVIVLAGFQAVNEVGDMLTLGRGGSDLSAVFLADALGADECQFYKDVEGVFTANPRSVPGSQLISHMSAREVVDMSEAGAKIVQLRAASYAERNEVSLRVLSSNFSLDNVGTKIDSIRKSQINGRAVGISYFDQQSKWDFQFPYMAEDCFLQFLHRLSMRAVSFHAVVQNRQAESISLFFLVNRSDSQLVSTIAKQLLAGTQHRASVEHNWSRLSVVGCDLVSHVETHQLVLSNLLKHNIKADVLLMTETQMSFLLPNEDLSRALNVLHDVLELSEHALEEEAISGSF